MSQVTFDQCFSTCGAAANATYQAVKETINENMNYEKLSGVFREAIKGSEIPFMVGTTLGTTLLYSMLSSNDKSTSICRRGFNKCTALVASLLIASGASTLAVVNKEAIEKAAREVARQVMINMPNQDQLVAGARELMTKISNNVPAVTVCVISSVGVAMILAEVALENEKINKRKELL